MGIHIGEGAVRVRFPGPDAQLVERAQAVAMGSAVEVAQSVSVATSSAAHRVLTAGAAMAGEIEIAKAALRELRRAQPNVSLAWIASQPPLREQDERDIFWKPCAAAAWISSAFSDQRRHQ